MAQNKHNVDAVLHEKQLVQELGGRIQRLYLSQWRSQIGHVVDMMLVSRDCAFAGLDNLCPDVREVALQILTYYWIPDGLVVSACKRLIESDKSVDVRHQALCSLGVIYMNTNDTTMLCELATLVASADEEPDIRLAAYRQLLLIRGESVEQIAVMLHQRAFCSILSK